MRKFLTIFALATVSLLCAAQEEETADSLFFNEPVSDMINDYSLIGVNYGMTFSNMYFSPSKHNRSYVMTPNYISVTYTKYEKMFGYLPYFGLVLGAAYGHEGFAFKPNKETGKVQDVDGASWCSMSVLEIPAMMQLHLDADPAKIMANVGVYGGWRQTISRTGASLDKRYANSFRSYENQIDYGLQGGVGFGLMFDPFEIHFNAMVRWSWSTFYEPDYASKYYYNYAYPFDFMATVGIHFQLTKRRGRTTSAIKQQARKIVYGTPENNSGQSR